MSSAKVSFQPAVGQEFKRYAANAFAAPAPMSAPAPLSTDTEHNTTNAERIRRSSSGMLLRRSSSINGVKLSSKLGQIFHGNTLTVNKNCNDDPKETALAKIAWAAASHNPRAAGFAGLSGFQQGEMMPEAFSEQLRRAFNIKLSPKELGAWPPHPTLSIPVRVLLLRHQAQRCRLSALTLLPNYHLHLHRRRQRHHQC